GLRNGGAHHHHGPLLQGDSGPRGRVAAPPPDHQRPIRRPDSGLRRDEGLAFHPHRHPQKRRPPAVTPRHTSRSSIAAAFVIVFSSLWTLSGGAGPEACPALFVLHTTPPRICLLENAAEPYIIGRNILPMEVTAMEGKKQYTFK